MKITYLGQAGLLFETNDLKIMIDPYLSDSVGKTNPAMKRRIPVEERFLEMQPDILIFTHNHLDHYDPETVEHYFKMNGRMTTLAPSSVWSEVRKFGGAHNFVQFDRHTQWSEGGVRFAAVKAAHSDPFAIGILLFAEGKTYYITGDTLYNSEIFEDLPKGIDLIFLPINGLGNNMNMEDAARFAKKSGAGIAIPLHTRLFDALDPAEFTFEPKIVPEYYKEIKI